MTKYLTVDEDIIRLAWFASFFRVDLLAPIDEPIQNSTEYPQGYLLN